MAKLVSAGVPDSYLDFLNSYLEPRIGRVSVEGALSDMFDIANSVFQGTVLGPSLWKAFFADVHDSATAFGAEDALFADDLTAYIYFDKSFITMF